jgi:hypothetical protein
MDILEDLHASTDLSAENRGTLEYRQPLFLSFVFIFSAYLRARAFSVAILLLVMAVIWLVARGRKGHAEPPGGLRRSVEAGKERSREITGQWLRDFRLSLQS